MKGHEVYKTIRGDLGMNWRRLRDRRPYENSPKNLVLRQAFALQLMSMKFDGKVVLNFDESTFTQLNNQMYSFSRPEKKNKRSLKALSKSVHLFLAVASDGKMFWAFVKGKNNAYCFSEFLRQLLQYLQRLDPDFKSRYILLLDNSPIHTAALTRKILDSHAVPTIFTGPASYDSLPVESIFASLKQQNFYNVSDQPRWFGDQGMQLSSQERLIAGVN